jgi:hypothetical protein
LVALLVAAPLAAHAGVVFGDIGYDVPGADQGREWVAIQNTGPDAVDLTGWRFFEGGVNHKLVPLGSALLPVGGSAVIVSSADGYVGDHPGYGGLLFKSSFSLKNSGETLSLKNASSTIVTSVTYAPKPVAPTSHASAVPKPAGNPNPASAVHTASAPPSRETAAATAATQTAPHPHDMLPWVGGVAAIIMFGVGAAFMMRPMPGREADHYRIIEEKND